MTEKLVEAMEYQASKYASEAVFDVAEAVAERFRAGGHVARVIDEVVVIDGQAARVSFRIEPLPPERVLLEMAREVADPDDEDAMEAAVCLRRSGYEGRLRGLATHVACVEGAIAALDAGVFPGDDWRVAYVRPYLLAKRAQLAEARS